MITKSSNVLSLSSPSNLNGAPSSWIPDFGQPLALMRALLVAVGLSFLLSQASLALLWMLASAVFCTKASIFFGFFTNAFTGSAGNDLLILEVALITLVVGAIVLRAFYAHFEKQEQQKCLLQANYDALQARIRPHFLFNSLNSVAELIAVDAPRAENAILDMSDLFRAALSQKGISSISEELEICEKYLSIEKLRMGERLRWHFDVDDEVKNWQLPTLWLQPLVENAVLHGVQKIADGGVIQVSLKYTDKRFVVQVENPLPLDTTVEAVSRGTGTALANVKARLDVFFRSDVVFSAGEREDRYLAELVVVVEK